MQSVLSRFLSPDASQANSAPPAAPAALAAVGPAGDETKVLVEGARTSWLIEHHDGALALHHFTPPATLKEIRGWYPDAVSIELEEQ